MSYTDYKWQKGQGNWHVEHNALCDKLQQDIPAIQTEIQNARGTKSTLDQRLDVVLNEDGTLKSSVVAYQSEWIKPSLTFTYVAANQFKVNGDQTDIYAAGRRLKINLSGSVVYTEVQSATYDDVANETTVTVVDSSLDNTLVDVEHSIIHANTSISSLPFSYTPGARLIPRAGSSGKLNVNWLDLSSQGFTNLIKNGNFASWSAGDTSAPDGWRVSYATIQKITTATDNSLGHDFSRIVTDASGNSAYIVQNSADNLILQYLKDVIKQQKKTVTYVVKVKTNSSKVYVSIVDGAGESSRAYHSGSGNWETLTVTKTYDGTETDVGVRVILPAADNTSNITIDVGEVSLYIGNLALPYQENPLDVSVLNKSAIVEQGYTNLIKNGNFVSWSNGTSSAPDGWVRTSAYLNVAQETTDVPYKGAIACKLTNTGGTPVRCPHFLDTSIVRGSL